MPDFSLSPITGPPIEPIALVGVGPLTIGRSGECDICLPDPSVSRRHATLARAHPDENWAITDAGSRHGVHVNGEPLERDTPAVLTPGARVRLGPWLFRMRDAESESSTMKSIDDTRSVPISRISRVELGDLAQRRLELLMQTARDIQGSEDEASIARAVTASLVAGAGFERAAVVRPVHGLDEVEILAVAHSGRPTPLRPSRTLLLAAAKDGVVRLEDTFDAQHAVSIISANVTSALCAPVSVGDDVDAFLYLDGAVAPHADAATFCAAIADLCGMAFSSHRRRELKIQQDRLVLDLNTARRVQERLMPPSTGRVGPITYAIHFQPGRVVAGDFFGVCTIGDRAAVFIGDVSGKGLGASLLMATIQARLETLLESDAPLPHIVARLSAYLAARSTSSEFATLFVGVLDAQARTLTCVDAGHGYVAVRRAGGAEIPVFRGGPPVGLDADLEYEHSVLALEPGDRIVLLSDGVPEQPDAADVLFGIQRITDRLAGTADPAADVAALLAALVEHAQSEAFADDVTIASIAWA